MDLFSRFKKDYFNYFLSTIIPVIITAVSIPLFKRILGAEHYGQFSLKFNSVLLFTAILSGWIWPSIIRFFSTSINRQSFARKSMLLTIITQSIFFIPFFLFVWLYEGNWMHAFFFSVTLFITSLQFSILALSQAVFLSRKSIFYELIRSITYITLALILLTFSGFNYLYSLFSAVIVSYLVSFVYLNKQTNKQLLHEHHIDGNEPEQIKNVFKKFILYGAPLSLWFVFASLITLTDKYFMLKTLGGEVQGNYQALFDFLSKSITIVVTPVTISLFPLLTSAFEKGQKKDIEKLLLKIIFFELLGLLVAAAAYWWFGAFILFTLIHIPATTEYKLMGLIILTATFVWQIAIVVQKKFELKYQSRYLLFMLIIAFSGQLLFYFIFHKSTNRLVVPTGYLLSTILYLFLISFGNIKNVVKIITSPAQAH